MNELELTRDGDDRRRYRLEGAGTLELRGWLSRSATADADGRSWRFTRRGVLRTVVEATDAAGRWAGEFRANGLRRGGTVTWGERELVLRAASAWRERYALADGERELVLIEGRGWGRRPVKVAVRDGADVPPALLLFAAYVVRGLAEDAGASAGGTTAATSAATSSG